MLPVEGAEEVLHHLPVGIELDRGRELGDERSALLSELLRGRVEPAQVLGDILQLLLVGDPPRHLHREPESGWRCLVPVLRHGGAWVAVERRVDLDDVEDPGVQFQVVGLGGVRRVEAAQPIVVPPAAASDAQLVLQRHVTARTEHTPLNNE